MPSACRPAATLFAVASTCAYVRFCGPNDTATRSGVRRAECSRTDDKFKLATPVPTGEPENERACFFLLFSDSPVLTVLRASHDLPRGRSDVPIAVHEPGALD